MGHHDEEVVGLESRYQSLGFSTMCEGLFLLEVGNFVFSVAKQDLVTPLGAIAGWKWSLFSCKTCPFLLVFWVFQNVHYLHPKKQTNKTIEKKNLVNLDDRW